MWIRIFWNWIKNKQLLIINWKIKRSLRNLKYNQWKRTIRIRKIKIIKWNWSI